MKIFKEKRILGLILLENMYLGAKPPLMMHLTLSNVINKNQFISLSFSPRELTMKTQFFI